MPLLAGWLAVSLAAAPAAGAEPDLRLFFQAASKDEKEARQALASLEPVWQDGYAGMLLDLARFMPPIGRPTSSAGFGSPQSELGVDDGGVTAPGFPPGGGLGQPEQNARFPQRVDPRRARLLRFLGKRTGQRFGDDPRRWRRWLWNQPAVPHADLAVFKAALYSQVDPRMADFFRAPTRPLIRLDEVDWGGVGVDGIPPLDHPRSVPAEQASYLKDEHVVFGLALGGEARAYPRRILAWHELARDRLGGLELAIVYCTLCGTVVPYASDVGGQLRTFGTSGLLYRSNKLMYDRESMSLWSTTEGRPVIGPLAGSGLELRAYPVVTTSWGEWRAAHPGTSVLSLDTGYERDYSEGAAYRDYFATDRLMFEVPRTDDRLGNKEEVLALLLRPEPASARERAALAIAARFLRKHPLHHLSFAGRDLVVVTSDDGANRVYETTTRFRARGADGRLEDDLGRPWTLGEDALVREGGEERAPRVAARRAFWFGWFAQFPETELVK